MNRYVTSKRFGSLVLILAASGALAVLGSAFAGSPDEMDANAKALTKLDDDWSKSALTRDPERIASFYADDAIAYPPNEPVAVGRAAAQKVWAAYFADPNFSISWKTLHAEASKSGDLGYTTGTYAASFKGPDGKIVTEKGKYACVWKLQKDGTWKAIHDIWNTDAK